MNERQVILRLICVIILMVGICHASSMIQVTATPLEGRLTEGQLITVPIEVNMSNLPELLGSYTAVLSWNAKVLSFSGYCAGSTDGFDSPVVNSGEVNSGRLIFAAANPLGAHGVVNILTVSFKVAGAVGSNPEIDLRFSAMAAAKTFTDLLQYVGQVQTGVENLLVEEIPDEYRLKPNYPNPFNPSTQIGYELPEEVHVQLVIYNSVGQEIRRLVDEKSGPGVYQVTWNGCDELGRPMPAGIYIYRLIADDFSAKQKMLLVK